MFLIRSEVDSIGVEGNQMPHHLKLHAFLKNVSFKNSVGDHVFIDEEKKPEAKYDILNYVTFINNTEVMVKVGQFIPRAPMDQEFTIHEEVIEWTWIYGQKTAVSEYSPSCGPGFRKTVWDMEPICCFDCVLCPLGEISNKTGIGQREKCPEDQYPNKERDRCLPKATTFLAIEEFLGMTLACAALSFSLLTTITVVLAFKATRPESRIRHCTGPRASNSFILISSLV
ncbi:hypothetical protein HPG69_012067 [Diceros bicornis minor]|uniref:GPCR family 3 nine cysteines domain-containing protein n=1 Tax=Diceros bicornis minor TaxID=77932 RepID=A0A7J7EYR3_DICBM|nr:hypothetical protein HPG69_012067 [Diceros bicornis minor]